MVFGHAVSWTFDLLTPKLNEFIFDPRCTADKNLMKVHDMKTMPPVPPYGGGGINC